MEESNKGVNDIKIELQLLELKEKMKAKLKDQLIVNGKIDISKMQPEYNELVKIMKSDKSNNLTNNDDITKLEPYSKLRQNILTNIRDQLINNEEFDITKLRPELREKLTPNTINLFMDSVKYFIFWQQYPNRSFNPSETGIFKIIRLFRMVYTLGFEVGMLLPYTQLELWNSIKPVLKNKKSVMWEHGFKEKMSIILKDSFLDSEALTLTDIDDMDLSKRRRYIHLQSLMVPIENPQGASLLLLLQITYYLGQYTFYIDWCPEKVTKYLYENNLLSLDGYVNNDNLKKINKCISNKKYRQICDKIHEIRNHELFME